jgi:hypothetical protein
VAGIKLIVNSHIRSGIPYLLITLVAFILFRKHFNGLHFVDDAYIYLQTVRNLVTGYGWGFNPGELVNACSSILYFLLLSLLAVVGHIIAPEHLSLVLVWLMVIFQIFCLTMMASLIYSAIGEQYPVSRWVLSLGLAFHPIFLLSSGMESALFGLMLVLSIRLYLSENWLLAGLALAGLTLTRPEGALLIPLLLVCKPPKTFHPWKMGLSGFLVPLMLWAGFSIWYFDALLPNSMTNKLDQVVSILHAKSFFGRFFRYTWFPPLSLALVGVGIYDLLVRMRSGDRFLPLLALYGVIQGVCYGLAGAKGGYFWYYVPAYLSFTILLYWGLRRACLWIADRMGWKPELQAGVTGFALCLGLTLSALTIINALGVIKPAPTTEYRNAAEYVAISEYVRTHMQSNSKVLTPEIGYIGYYSRHPIIDPFGLIHAAPEGNAVRKPFDYLINYRPEVVVMPRAWIKNPNSPRATNSDRYLARHYERAARFGRLDVLMLSGKDS